MLYVVLLPIMYVNKTIDKKIIKLLTKWYLEIRI